MAVILGAFVGLSSPALAGKGGGGGGQNASSTHASTGSPSGNQTQTKQQSNTRKAGTNPSNTGKTFLRYDFGTVYTTKIK
jgi:hypothetical protein